LSEVSGWSENYTQDLERYLSRDRQVLDVLLTYNELDIRDILIEAIPGLRASIRAAATQALTGTTGTVSTLQV
jgi:hypothetical protein